MIYKQAQAKELFTENNQLRAKAGLPPRTTTAHCFTQKGIKELVAENAKLRGESKRPLLDALAASHAANPNGNAAEHLAAVAAASKPAAPVAAAPAALPTAAAIAAEIVKVQAAAAAAEKVKTKAQFDTLTPQAKCEFFRNGGKLC